MDNWISTKECLPSKYREVLLIDSIGNMFTGYFLGERFEDSNGYDTLDITHWQPLPKPPKE